MKIPRFLRIILTVVGVLLLAAVGGWVTYSHGYWYFVTPDKAKYPVWGIDVSHHQGVIDWRKVRAAGAEFVFIKAGEGATYTDPEFAANWEGAVSAGLQAAPYHFFTLCRSGADQARNFLQKTAGISPTLPVVVDLEFVGNCAERPPVEVVQRELGAFLKEVEARFGYRALFYTTYQFKKAYLQNAFLENGLWIRDIFKEPNAQQTPWVMWQFADHARIDGITGPVDLNVFGGSRDNWRGAVTTP